MLAEYRLAAFERRHWVIGVAWLQSSGEAVKPTVAPQWIDIAFDSDSSDVTCGIQLIIREPSETVAFGVVEWPKG